MNIGRLSHFILLILCFNQISVAQSSLYYNAAKIDSLVSVLPASGGEKKVDILHALILNLWLNYPDSAKHYAREAIDLSDKLEDARLQSISLRMMGTIQSYQAKYDSGIFYNQEANKLAIKINDSTLISTCFSNIGVAHYSLGNYPEALENLLRAVNMKIKIKQDYGLGSALNNLGLVYSKLNDNTTAREYFMEANQVAMRLHDDNIRLYASNGIAQTFLIQHNFADAKKTYEESLKICKNINNKNWHAVAISGLAQSYFGLGKLDSAQLNLREALAIRQGLQDAKGISEIYYFTSKIQAALGHLDSAFYWLNASQRIASKVKSKDRLLENFGLYIVLYARRNRYDSALLYQQRYDKLQTQEYNENTIRSIAGVVSKIKEEETTRRLADKDALLKQKTWQIYFALAIATLILVIASIFYRFYRAQRQLAKDLVATNNEIKLQKDVILDKNRELHDLNEEKNNLIAIVAHDLRSPLVQVHSLVQIIKKQVNLNGEVNKFFGLIETSSLNGIALISKILDMEALDSKQVNMKLEKLNLSEKLSAVTDTFSVEALKKNIQLQKQIQEDVIVVLDKTYIKQIVENLISNAIKFSPANSKVSVKLCVNNGNAICEIKDEGPGLNETDKTKLFGKFQKLSARPTGGEVSIGLGLSIAKKFVDAMKGEIWCESELGKGTSFLVSFNLQ